MEVRILNGRSSGLVLLIFNAVVLGSVFGGEAAACSCMFGGVAPCQEYWKTDAVFAGTVVGISKVTVTDGNYKSEKRLVRLAVIEAFRGVQEARVEVITGWGGGDCGYAFEDGETYLVYAHRAENGKRLYTGICTRTRLFAEASEDIAYIRSLPTAEASAVVFGKVNKRNYEWKEGEISFKPVGSAELVIEGAGPQIKARTDAQGDYRITGLAPGAYKIKLSLPEGLTDNGMMDGSTVEGKVEVVERGCAQYDFYLESDTRISGRVVDAAGQPAVGVPLEMKGAPSDTRNINTFLRAQTDAEGRFEFKTVPPGDYLLGVRLLSSSGDEVLPYPRTYFPGVGKKAQAGVVSVREGARRRDVELVLPPRLAEYTVEGSVIWADGRPAPGVNIYLELQEEGELAALRSLRADERGRFTLKVYQGLTYKVSAYPQGATGNAAQSQWVDAPPTSDAPPIKLVLPVLKK